MLLVVSVYAFVSNFISSSIAPALPLWAYTFPQDPRTYSELSRLVAVGPPFHPILSIPICRAPVYAQFLC